MEAETFEYVSVRLSSTYVRELDRLAAADPGNVVRPVKRADMIRKALATLIEARNAPGVATDDDQHNPPARVRSRR